jgi:hypothetical protein
VLSTLNPHYPQRQLPGPYLENTSCVTQPEFQTRQRSIWLVLAASNDSGVVSATLEDVKLILDGVVKVQEAMAIDRAASSFGPQTATASQALERQSSSPGMLLSGTHATAHSFDRDAGPHRRGSAVEALTTRSPDAVWRHPEDVALTRQGLAFAGTLPLPTAQRNVSWVPDAPNQRLSGSGSLYCNLVLRLEGGREHRERLNVQISTTCLPSRHIFLAVGPDHAWALDDAYPAFLSHALSLAPPASPAAPPARLQRCLEAYNALWAHGLALAFLRKRSWALRRPFTAYEAVQALGRAGFDLVAARPPQLHPHAALTLYALLGQALLMLRDQGGYPEAADYPDVFWG